MALTMGKKLALIACTAMAALAITACSMQTTSTSSTASESASATAESAASQSSAQESGASSDTAAALTLGAVSNTIAQDEEALVNTYASAFTQETYTDADTGLSVTYNLFLPEGYDPQASYPMIVFIADSSCVGNDATRSLTQGLGALVWATDEWQSAYPCIVCVPTYPETILDDHGSYTTTEYVELTQRLIKSVAGDYAVDTSRIYGAGQSMGCMTTLILASEYPDLYAGCMFVDGQWDISTLSGLEGQTFVYFAAEDDSNAWAGMQEVMAMYDADGKTYTYAQWDGTWSPDELSAAAEELFAAGTDANFISWKTGTIDASSSSMGGGSGMGMGTGGGNGNGTGPGNGTGGGNGGGMGSASYHMASFDYAYNCIAVMEWLFQQ